MSACILPVPCRAIYRGPMTVAENLLLLAIDPESGKIRIGSTQSDPVLGGAALIELVNRGRLALEGEGRKARVVVADPAPVDDPPLEAALARIRQRGRQAPKSAVTRLGKKYRGAALEQMQREGDVRRLEQRVLGFPVERYEIVDGARRGDLLGRVDAVLLRDQPADEETGPLVGLLLAADLLGLVVTRADRRQARARAKVVAEGAWASDGVRSAIASAQAAMTAAIGAAAAAGASSS